MRLHIKCFHHTVDGERNMELLVNMEDLFAMLDEIKPRIIADYLCGRMREPVLQSSLLVNSEIVTDGGVPEVLFSTEEGGGHGTL